MERAGVYLASHLNTCGVRVVGGCGLVVQSLLIIVGWYNCTMHLSCEDSSVCMCIWLRLNCICGISSDVPTR